VVRLSSDVRKQQDAVEKAYARERNVRGLFAVDGPGTLACGQAISHLGLRAKGVKGGGYDLLPDDLELVANGTLDFDVDQQPYVQGFAPVLQLFLARISQGVIVPWDTETSVLLRRADVRAFLATKSRFEGSSSRQAYPLRRA
jgi:simple sugar transport system substrate-binding protein